MESMEKPPPQAGQGTWQKALTTACEHCAHRVQMCTMPACARCAQCAQVSTIVHWCVQCVHVNIGNICTRLYAYVRSASMGMHCAQMGAVYTMRAAVRWVHVFQRILCIIDWTVGFMGVFNSVFDISVPEMSRLYCFSDWEL